MRPMGVPNWRAELKSALSWRRSDNRAGEITRSGEAGGYMMTCDEIGDRRAYMKPTKVERGPFTARAAREKIVADLAHDIGANVPPVVLWERPNAGEEETFCCLSMVMCEHQRAWSEVKTLIMDPSCDRQVHEAIMATLPRDAAAGLALDAWVMQADHDNHDANMFFGWDASPSDEIAGIRGHLFFLDYSFSLGHRWCEKGHRRVLGWKPWDQDGWKATVKIPFPPYLDRYLLRDHLESTLQKIEAFPEETLNEVVLRIPDEYMSASEKQMILRGLVERRQIAREGVKSQLPQGGRT
jgi:hypothetical protein